MCWRRLATRVEFFALDSTNLDRQQLRWLDERLAASRADWKICFFHHPLYTSGRYRIASRAFRFSLEPILVRHGVDAVFSGHEHIYQRSTLLGGIQYFISGGAGSLRPGDGAPAGYVARTYAGDYHFMLIEIDGGELHFQAISRSGATIDAGTLYKDGHATRHAGEPDATTDTAGPVADRLEPLGERRAPIPTPASLASPDRGACRTGRPRTGRRAARR